MRFAKHRLESYNTLYYKWYVEAVISKIHIYLLV